MNKEVKPATLKQRITLLGLGGLALIVLFYILVRPKKS